VALYIGSHELGVVWGCLDKIHGPSPAEHAGPFDLDSLGPDYPVVGGRIIRGPRGRIIRVGSREVTRLVLSHFRGRSSGGRIIRSTGGRIIRPGLSSNSSFFFLRLFHASVTSGLRLLAPWSSSHVPVLLVTNLAYRYDGV